MIGHDIETGDNSGQSSNRTLSDTEQCLPFQSSPLQTVERVTEHCELFNGSCVKFASRKQLCDGMTSRTRNSIAANQRSLSQSDSHINCNLDTCSLIAACKSTSVTSCRINRVDLCNSIQSMDSSESLNAFSTPTVQLLPAVHTVHKRPVQHFTSNEKTTSHYSQHPRTNHSIPYKHITQIVNETDHTYV